MYCLISGLDLYNASARGDLTEVERLLDAGVDVNCANGVRDILYYYIIE